MSQSEIHQLTIQEARALATIASRLDGKTLRRAVKPQDILDLIEHLGMIQLDTISVVSRAHETAVFSRLGPYNRAHWTALFNARRVTEYLAHAVAIVPTATLPLLRHMMAYYRTADARWRTDLKFTSLAEEVLARVRREGPLTSRHFTAPPTTRQAAWSNWYGRKLERGVLAGLWMRGDLLISLRDLSFTRWFDLPERVAPGHWQLEPPPQRELEKILVRKSVQALGVATAAWVRDYWRTGDRAYVSNLRARSVLAELAEEGVCLRVQVPEIDVPTYLDSQLMPALAELRQATRKLTRTTFLSPFDNLIWNRPRMRELWQMDYTIEIYTPAEKRQYGYYTMPILHRGNLIGRIDPSFNRKESVLYLRALHLQPGVRTTRTLARAIGQALTEFTDFLGGTRWQIENCEAAELGHLLRTLN